MAPIDLIKVVKFSDRSGDTNKREIRLKVNSPYCPFHVHIMTDICDLWKLVSGFYEATEKNVLLSQF